MMAEVLHGLIQQAAKSANALKRMERQGPDGTQLWLWDNDAWRYVGRFTRKRDLEDFLVSQVTQEEI